MARTKTQNVEYMGARGQDLVDGKVERKRRPPSLRQRRLFMELTRRKTLKEATIAAGYSAKTPTSKIIAKLNETTLAGELELLGFNQQNVARRIVDGLDGMMVKPIGKGEYVEAPDWTNRHRYLTTALRIFGVQVTGVPKQPEQANTQLNLTIYKNVFNMMDRSMQVAHGRQKDLEVAELDMEE